MDSLLLSIQSLFSSCSSWFTSIFSASGMTGVFLTIIFIILVSKFILRPIFGGGGLSGKSDQAKKSGGDNDE